MPKKDPTSISNSFWIDDANALEFPKLDSDISVDVAIVGAGITGTTLAYLLSKSHRVAVIDNGPIGLGDTGHTTAHLTWNVDGFVERAKANIENAKLVQGAHAEAIDLIQLITEVEKIKCDF